MAKCFILGYEMCECYGMYIMISHMVWLILAIALIFEQCVKFENPISTLWLVIKKIFACSWFTLAHHARAVMQFTQLQWCIMGIKIVSFENKEIVHHHINYHWRWEEAHKQKRSKNYLSGFSCATLCRLMIDAICCTTFCYNMVIFHCIKE